MTVESRQVTRLPTFAAPIDLIGYTRRNVLDPHRVIEALTPQCDLFVLAHLGIPRVDADRWRLEIAGLVERPVSLSLADLRQLPVRQAESFHQCAGAPRQPDVAARRIANVVWGGVDLSDLLRT
jgi:sulfane dehydrogenase subunit SoxC